MKDGGFDVIQKVQEEVMLPPQWPFENLSLLGWSAWSVISYHIKLKSSKLALKICVF